MKAVEKNSIETTYVSNDLKSNGEAVLEIVEIFGGT